MFKVVGIYGDYAYVHDTSDNTCEMIELNVLKRSGIEFSYALKTQNSVDKMHMLYKFNEYRGVYCLTVPLSYTLPIKSGRSLDVVNVYGGLYMLPSAGVDTSISNLKGYSLDSDYIFVYSMTVSLPYVIDDKNLQSIYVSGVDSYMGLILPSHMFSYICSLLMRGRFSDVLNAFGSFMSSRVKFHRLKGNNTFDTFVFDEDSVEMLRIIERGSV